ncbi:MAG: hypothetical protein WAU01_12455 [Saprospiraceae bacterium]
MFGISKKEMERKAAYQQLSIRNEMQYLDTDEFGTKAYLSHFELFKKRNATIRNLSQKKSHSLENEINIFDMKYKVHTGKTVIIYDQTVFFINSKNLSLPEFMMKPEHLGHKIASYFGWDDIDFVEYPVFSDQYHLTGSDSDYIRYAFDDKILKFFSKTSGWTIEAANYYLIFYSHNSLVPPNILQDFYRLGMGIYDMFREGDE